MSDIKKEYAEFGPWLVEIKAEDDIPQQFDHLKDQILGGIFSFKIPIAIDRRDLKPGMLMYNIVITLTDTKFMMFKFQDEAATVKEVEIKDIVYIQKVINLLTGELIVATSSEKLVIDFNPVGSHIVENAISIIRQKYVSDVEKVDLDAISEEVAVESFLYQSLLMREMIKERVKLISYQPFMELKRGRATNVKNRKDIYDEPVLQDSLFLTTAKELLVLTRVREVKEQKEADYGYKHTYIPLELISSISLEKDLEFEQLRDVKISVKDASITVTVGADFSIATLKELLKI